MEKLENLIAVPPLKAAELVGRTRSCIFKAIKDGKLTARKDGKATVIEVSELRRWVKSLPLVEPQL